MGSIVVKTTPSCSNLRKSSSISYKSIFHHLLHISLLCKKTIHRSYSDKTCTFHPYYMESQKNVVGEHHIINLSKCPHPCERLKVDALRLYAAGRLNERRIREERFRQRSSSSLVLLRSAGTRRRRRSLLHCRRNAATNNSGIDGDGDETDACGRRAAIECGDRRRLAMTA